MLTSWTIVYAKRLQVLFFTRRPSRPMSVWRQNMYLRNSLVVAMLVALVPFTYLLRQVVSCGPHRLPVSIGGVQYDGTAPNSTLSVIDVVMARVDETPGVVSLTFHLLTNAFVLWLAILALSAYASLLDKAAGAAKDDLRLVKTRLRLELREKMVRFGWRGSLAVCAFSLALPRRPSFKATASCLPKTRWARTSSRPGWRM